MEYKHLTTDNFYALRDLLDGVFSRKYGRETRFIKLFPRLFTEPDADVMDAHIGTFDGERLVGTAAMYRLDYVVGGEHIKLTANGNVAVHEDYRGRGIMTEILGRINDECDSFADLGYLHGDPVRYGRFGFIGGGIEYLLTFRPEENSAFTFAPMSAEDVPLYQVLTVNKPDYIVRRDAEVIPALRAGGRQSVAVKDPDGRTVGFMSLNAETGAVEEYVLAGELETAVFRALAAEIGKPVCVRLSGYDKGTMERLRGDAELKLSQPALFRIINPDRLSEAAIAAGLSPDTLYAPYLS